MKWGGDFIIGHLGNCHLFLDKRFRLVLRYSDWAYPNYIIGYFMLSFYRGFNLLEMDYNICNRFCCSFISVQSENV